MNYITNPNKIFKCPVDGWKYALWLINSHGTNYIDENGYNCREVLNLMVTIENPRDGWPLPGSNWDMAGLDKYAEQLLSPENPGFDYTYGERLNAYGYAIQVMEGEFVWDGYNQIDYIIRKLRENPTTRRAIAITWSIPDDPIKKHVPCLQSVDFLYRAGKLHLTAYFRSWDVKQAAPANMYGLARLLSYVAEKVGVPVGSLTVIAASAHCYEV